jgi:DnaJ family protein A protein 2
MPVYRNPFQKGHLYVKFEVEFPAPGFFTADRLKALEAALPPREPTSALVDGMEVEEVVLSNVDPMQQERSQYNGNAADDDDENGGPGVQCASQ